MFPEKLYHVTLRSLRESIEAVGLSVKFDETGFGAVFLTDNPANAIGNVQWDVWEVEPRNLTDLEEDFGGDPEGELWYVTYQTIPPNQLNLLVGVQGLT